MADRALDRKSESADCVFRAAAGFVTLVILALGLPLPYSSIKQDFGVQETLGCYICNLLCANYL